MTYAIKKLDALGLIVSGRSGNEKTVTLNKKGEGVIRAYTRLREQLLVAPVKSAGCDERRLSEVAALDAGDVGTLRSGRAGSSEFMSKSNGLFEGRVIPVTVCLSAERSNRRGSGRKIDEDCPRWTSAE